MKIPGNQQLLMSESKLQTSHFPLILMFYVNINWIFRPESALCCCYVRDWLDNILCVLWTQVNIECVLNEYTYRYDSYAGADKDWKKSRWLFPLFSCPVLMSLCPLQPDIIVVLGWQEWKLLWPRCHTVCCVGRCMILCLALLEHDWVTAWISSRTGFH